jgi:hypothetical protein
MHRRKLTLLTPRVGSSKKDAQYCFELLEKAIQRNEEKFLCKVVGVCTDDCSTMKAMHKMVGEKFVGIKVFGCNAHLLDLLGEKLTSKRLQEASSIVQAFMKNHHVTSGCLKEMNALCPVMPNSTRWNSQMDSFANYMINHTKYLDVMRR